MRALGRMMVEARMVGIDVGVGSMMMMKELRGKLRLRDEQLLCMLDVDSWLSLLG